MGCGKNNIYLDCGSAVETDTSNDSGLMATDWKDGCMTELAVTEDEVEICMKLVKSGVEFPQGLLLFSLDRRQKGKHRRFQRKQGPKPVLPVSFNVGGQAFHVRFRRPLDFPVAGKGAENKEKREQQENCA